MTPLLKAKSVLYWAIMDLPVEEAMLPANAGYLKALMEDEDIHAIVKGKP